MLLGCGFRYLKKERDSIPKNNVYIFKMHYMLHAQFDSKFQGFRPTLRLQDFIKNSFMMKIHFYFTTPRSYRLLAGVRYAFSFACSRKDRETQSRRLHSAEKV